MVAERCSAGMYHRDGRVPSCEGLSVAVDFHIWPRVERIVWQWHSRFAKQCCGSHTLSPHSSSSLKLHIRAQGIPLKSCQNIAKRTTLLLEKIGIWCFGFALPSLFKLTEETAGIFWEHLSCRQAFGCWSQGMHFGCIT